MELNSNKAKANPLSKLKVELKAGVPVFKTNKSNQNNNNKN